MQNFGGMWGRHRSCHGAIHLSPRFGGEMVQVHVEYGPDLKDRIRVLVRCTL